MRGMVIGFPNAAELSPMIDVDLVGLDMDEDTATGKWQDEDDGGGGWRDWKQKVD